VADGITITVEGTVYTVDFTNVSVGKKQIELTARRTTTLSRDDRVVALREFSE